MRALIAIACSGCSSLLGISDPTPASGDSGPHDGMVDSHIDAPPPCAASITLKPEVTSALGKTGSGFVIGRFDLGLEEDIAVATGADVTILYGNRTGAFGGTADVVATAAVDLVVEDFDGIGFDDLVTWTATTVVAHRQNRALDPPFEVAQPLTGPFTNVTRVIAEQLDGNARADVFVYDTSAGSRVYTSNAGTPGTFARDTSLVGTGADELILMRQMNNALRSDALFVNGTEVKLSLQTTSFQPLALISGSGSRGIGVGQFDADALVDIVVSTTGGLALLRQNPATPGTFMAAVMISPLTANAPLLISDVNDDGRDDIVLPNAAILQCPPVGGIGVFTQVEAITAPQPAKFVDVNGDTKPDLVRLDGTSIKVRLR